MRAFVIGVSLPTPSIAAHYRPLFERLAGRQNHDIESADEVWAFFASGRVL